MSDYYNLSRPDTYTIWVIRPLPPSVFPHEPKKFWKGSVRSNTITVTIAAVASMKIPPSAAKQPFSVTLTAPNKPLKAGSELRLLATTRNTSDHNIVFVVSPGQIPEDGFRYTIKVLDAHGHPAPPSARVLQLERLREEAQRKGKPVVGAWSSNLGRTLQPGKSFVGELNVTKFYDLTEPGTYTIWVIRPIEPWQRLGKGSVRSNTVTVTVVK